MEPLAASVIPVKCRKGKIEFTAKPAIGASDAHPKDPPTSRQRRAFGTSRCRNVPKEVPPYEPFIKTRTIPTARKSEKASMDFSEKKLRNLRKETSAVRQIPITSSPGSAARAGVDNLKPKLKSGPPSSAPKTSSPKSGQVDPKPWMSMCSLETSPSNPKENNIGALQTPVASAAGITVKYCVHSLNPKPNDGARALSAAAKKFYPDKSANFDPKTKGICLPGTLMGNLMEDDEAVPQTPVASFPHSPNSAAPFAAEKPSTNKKTGEMYQKLEDEMKYSSGNDIAMLPTPKPSSDDKTSDLGLNKEKNEKKKSVCFQEKSPRLPKTDGAVIPQTPTAPVLGSAVKPRRSGTPYHTAESCRGCRLDRLETASYWLAQIKIAESSTKHFVSAAFFRLAIESKAEPVRNLRVELRRYLARHPHLSEHLAWKDVLLKYGVANEGGGGANCLITRDIGLIQGDSS